MTSEADRQALLLIARDAVAAHVNGALAPEISSSGSLGQPAGVFVSLHLLGELRGCIGHIETDLPLAHVVARCARAACSEDPRFPSVTARELPAVDIEISILGPLERFTSPDEIEIGRHGLLVERGRQRGLLLPQVAVEWKWQALAFLEEACRKAGLPRESWRHGATLYRFEAEVFGESSARRA